MIPASVNIGSLLDVDAYWREGGQPWTFFAYPTSLADSNGFPSDKDAIHLLAELQARGVRVGVWKNSPVEGTCYFACVREEREKLHLALENLESEGRFGREFLAKRCEELFSLTNEAT